MLTPIYAQGRMFRIYTYLRLVNMNCELLIMIILIEGSLRLLISLFLKKFYELKPTGTFWERFTDLKHCRKIIHKNISP